MKKLYAITLLITSLLITGCANKLEQAVVEGNMKTLKEAVEVDHMDVSSSNYGYTPLMYAVMYNKYDAAKYLLEHGADFTDRKYLLCTAVTNDNLKMVSLLREYGAETSGFCEGGFNPRTVIEMTNDPVLINYISQWKLKEANITQEQMAKKSDAINNGQVIEQDILQAKADIQEKQDELEKRVDKFESEKDFNGLKQYTDKNPNAVYFIKDNMLRLALMGPKGLKVGDIREYLKAGKSEAILAAMIKQQEVPYKKFTLAEIDMLEKMGLTEKVIVAMINVTTALLHDEKLRKQQEYYLAEERKIAAFQQQTGMNQNTVDQSAEQPGIKDKVEDEVIKQGVGMLLDSLFHR